MFGLVHERSAENVESRETEAGTALPSPGELQRGGGPYYQGTRIMWGDALGADQPVSGSSYWQALNRDPNLRSTDF